MMTAIILNFRRAGFAALSQTDPFASLLAELCIGHTEHLHILHFRMRVKKPFDLTRVHVSRHRE